MNTPASSSEPSSWAPKPKKSRKLKLLLIAGGTVLGLGAVLVLLAPTIAGSVGPGMIESAASKSIKGSLKVNKLDVGWFSDTSVGPIELRDEKGKLTAKLSVDAPVSLWRVVSEGWWSARRLDVGTVKLAGMIDLDRDEGTGKTNLERAIEPKQPAPGKPAPASGGGLEALKAGLSITSLDIVIREKKSDGSTGPDMGVKGLKGDANIEFGGPTIKVTADLSGSPIGTAAAAPMRLKLDAMAKSLSKGSFDVQTLDDARIKADITNAPIAVADGLGGMGGALLSAIGDGADVKVDGEGNLKDGKLKASIASIGVQGAFDLRVKDGVLTGGDAAAPGTNQLSLRSTEFLAKLPQLRGAFARTGEQVKLTGPAPSVELTIEKLRLPMPSMGGIDTASIDARGMGLIANLRTGAMSGQIALQPGAGGQPASDWRSFAAEPVRLAVQASDLAQPLTITGGTRATLDNQSAGDVALSATVSGLLDDRGRVKALGTSGLLAGGVDADVRVVGASTALLQPLLSGMNLPLELRTDMGPTLDATAQAKIDLSSYRLASETKGAGDAKKASGAQASEQALPPADVRFSVQSQNVQASGEVRVENNLLSTSGAGGVSVSIAQAAPMLTRVLSATPPAPAEITGAGRVQASLSNVQVDLGKLKGEQAMSALRMSLSADVRDLNVRPTGLASPAGASAPLEIQSMNVSLTLTPGSAPTLTQTGSLRHEGQPFASRANITLEGLKSGRIPSGGGLDALFRFGASGNIALENVPRSTLAMIPGAELYLSDRVPGDDLSRLIRGAVGASASVTATFAPIAGAEGGTSARIQVTTQGQGVGADVAAKVTRQSASIDTLGAFFAADPATLNPVLAAGTPAGQAPLRVAQAFRVTLSSAQPITIPLSADKGGALSPNWAGASDATLNIKADNEIAIDNVSVGADAQGRPLLTELRLRNLAAVAKAPLSALASDQARASKRLNATMNAQVATGAGRRIADLAAELTSTLRGGEPDASVRLSQIDTPAADQLLQRGGMLSGALGDKADVNLRVTPRGQGVLALVGDIKAPRLNGATISLVQDQDKITLQQPTSITWIPEAAFVSKYLLKSDAPGSTISVTQIAPISLQLNKLAIATGKQENGRVVAGPLKPGVFALDASVSVPSLGANVASSDGRGAPTALTFDSTRVGVRGGDVPGQIDADLNIARIAGAAGSGKASTAKVRISNLADAAGVVQADRATYDLDADLVQFPTPIVDQLANQKGIMTEALGPTVDVRATCQNVTLGPPGPTGGAGATSGRVEARITSQRASAEILGDVRSGAFVQSGTTGGRIVEIRPQLLQTMAGSVPLLQSVEKSTSDAPGIIQAENLMVPVDGDLRKLNGVVRIDPGIAKFTTQGFLSDVVQLVGIKAAGELGNKIEPFVVRLDSGVASYERFRLPLGQFNIETTGKVDLVNRQIDVLTYIPLGLLTDKAVGLFGGGGLGGKLGVLDKATMFPWRVRGSLDNPRIEPDVGRFAQETAGRLIDQPVKQIQNELDKTIKDIFKPKPKEPPKK